MGEAGHPPATSVESHSKSVRSAQGVLNTFLGPYPTNLGQVTLMPIVAQCPMPSVYIKGIIRDVVRAAVHTSYKVSYDLKWVDNMSKPVPRIWLCFLPPGTDTPCAGRHTCGTLMHHAARLLAAAGHAADR